MSLLFYLTQYKATTVEIASDGRDLAGCGSSQWRCKEFDVASSHLAGIGLHTISVVDSVSLNELISFSTNDITLSSATPTTTISVSSAATISISGHTLTLSSLLFDGLSQDRSTAFISLATTGAVSVSSCSFTRFTRSSGNGAVFSVSLSASNSLNMNTVHFSKCESEKGGPLFVDVSDSTAAGKVTFVGVTFGTESDKNVGTAGNNLYLKCSSMSSASETGIASLSPTLPTTKEATDLILNDFVGRDSSNAEVSLLLIWNVHTSGDVTVMTSGHPHANCGLVQLPCSSLAQGHLGVKPNGNTVVITDNQILSTTLTITQSQETITSDVGVRKVTVQSGGSIILNQPKSTLNLLNLLFVIDSASQQTVLLSVSAGQLTILSCAFGEASTPSTLTQSLISVRGGSLVMSSTTVECVKSNCEVDVPFISIEGGEVVLDQTSLTTPQTMTITSSSLIVQTKGSLTMKNMVVTDITLQTGDGSAISAALTTNTDRLSIVSTTFASCSSSAGNGGALAVTITSGSLSLNTCHFESCSSAMNGGAVWLDLSQMPSPSQYSLLKTTFGTDGSANIASGKGHCVFVLGEDLRRVIVRSRWEGSFEEAEEDDLWGIDKTTPPSGISLLSILQSHVMGVGEGGRDDATGTLDAPFKTLRRCFMETEQSDGPFDVVVVGRARIGQSCSLEDQPGWTMDVSGSGSGGSCEVLCVVSDEKRKPGTASSPVTRAMITLSGQTLSFFDIQFSSFSGPRSMQFVFSLLTSSHLTLSSCSLSSSSPIAVSLVSASAISSFSADDLSMNAVSFVGKAALLKFGDSSEITLTSCSFLSVSLEGGALLWGTTSGVMKVTNTSFSHCNGEEFGSVIRMRIVGITATIINCTFTSCSTRVRMGEKGERSVVGGGCVVVEMMKRTISTRRLPSTSVDLSLSSFSDCTLSNTDTSSSQSSLSEFVGGSGFLIIGNENTDSVILQKVTLSRCLCAGFGKMSGFDGGVVVVRRYALFTDRRGSSVRESGMGSVQLR
ncbi:hypothetical protein BLNAU_16434 [Blattamonas nauphoetae]|uniref:Uncharacterized protein n=1 Tax=Blattamonas nauphoetae TaxID=2049346 RepID=A0ABQ9XBK3_9EUKA|nr:hypothetical protein BLNAU_16434 [Blattamonas nauphoetae]